MRVGAGILTSRLLGLVRERVFAHFFGSTDFADAWRAALRLPNVVRNLLGEGTLSASMIPVYAGFLEEGREDDARRFAGAALGILAVVAGGVALVGAVSAPLLVRLLFPVWSPEKQEVTATLVAILFPMVGIFVLSAWAMAVLDSHRRFFVSYVAPALWNVALIAAMVGGGLYWGLGQRDLVVLLGWSALVGGALQFGLQLPFALHHLGRVRPTLGRGVEGVPEAMRAFGPVVAARGVVNLSGWFEVVLAGFLATGAVAVLGYAQTLYLLPISLFGMSVAASELPELSRMGEGDRLLLARRVAEALHRVSYFVVPSALAYLTLGDVAIAALFETGAFGDAQTLVTWGVLVGFAVGLPATACSRVLSSGFYALRDTRTPARTAYARVAASIVCGVALMIPLDRVGVGPLGLGAAGLAAGTAVGAWLELALLRRALGARIGAHGPGAGPVLRMVLAGTVAAAVGVGLQLRLPTAWVTWAPGDLRALVIGVETLVPFGVVYLVATALIGVGAGSARDVHAPSAAP